eukprot:295828-Pelagomonas_calceolata.AAC.3
MSFLLVYTRVDYTQPSNIPTSYLQNLLNYLVDFHDRTQPLYQLQKQLAKTYPCVIGNNVRGYLGGYETNSSGVSTCACYPCGSLGMLPVSSCTHGALLRVHAPHC